MTHEQYLALEMIARLANRFGPASRIAKELPGWLEYLTEVECPERPRTRPSSQWWNKIRTLAHGRNIHVDLRRVLQVVRRVRACR